MNIDMNNFQPLALLNQLSNGDVKLNSGMQNDKAITRQNTATNVVNSKLYEALGGADNNTSDDIFDFEKVGKNILGFVKDAILSAKNEGASQDKLDSMLSDAQTGIKDGLANASKTLKEMGLLTDDIKQGINQTQDFLNNGIKAFSSDISDNNNDIYTPSSTYREASHYNLTKDASFSFTTKEGDKVNITFNSNYLQQNVSVMHQSEQNSSSINSQKTEFQSAFSFEVNGDLNEQEQKAINELMGNLQNVSDLFFEGSLDDAFEVAKSISMDPTHLAAFSMDLQRTETVVSIKEYQQQMPGKEVATQLIPVNDELTKAYENAKPFAIEEHLTELLGWLIPEQPEKENILKYSQAILDKLTKLEPAA